MFFDTQSSPRSVPNMEKIKAFDGYYAYRREEAKARKAN
jgi:hypothetical protein